MTSHFGTPRKIRTLVKGAYQKSNFLISQPKHDVGTQKNRLNETVLLSTQNICLKLWVRKYLQFYAEKLCFSKPVKLIKLKGFFFFKRCCCILQLEDAEYSSQSAIKAKKTIELELADLQQQIDELFKSKQEVYFLSTLKRLYCIWSPYSKLQINQVEEVQRTAAGWICRKWWNTRSVREMLDELEWPSLEDRRDWSSLLLFHKIHSGAVSIEKDKYLTTAHSLKSTRSSHSAQYCRYLTYSDDLKSSFLAHLSLQVSFCDRSLSVIPRPSIR